MSDPLDPNKYHVLSPRRVKVLILMGLFIGILTVPPTLYHYYKYAVNRPSQTDKEITFEIKKGNSLAEITDALYTKGAINSKFLFTFYVYLNKLDNSLQAGVYTIKAGTSIAELANLLQHGKDDIRITFLEGWRVEEFAREANKKFGSIGYNKFIELAKNYEGYLFPDTYLFNRSVQEDEMVNRLTSTSDEKTGDLLAEENLKRAGLAKEQAVIFASIVEREVRTPEDRKIVAGILIKRWKQGVKLEADATTQYAVALSKLCPPVSDEEKIYQGVLCMPTQEDVMTLDWWPGNLTSSDLDSNSPYNTRKNAGLPPTPISSFSLATLQSVLNYADTDYLYYLTDSKGITHFSKTLEEQNENISKYLSD